MANKYHFGLKNAYYAVLTETTDVETGDITESYGTPKRLLGAVSTELSPAGSSSIIHADDIGFAEISNNQGYSGSIEVVDIPDSALVDIFGMVQNSSKTMITEYADSKIAKIALMFEIQGDESATRYCFYRCSLKRPAISSSTKKDSIDAQTVKCEISVLPRLSDECLRSHAVNTDENYEDWFKSVPAPIEKAQG